MIDQEVANLKQFIRSETEARQEFNKDVHTFLPSSFLPQLRDTAPELHLDGVASEYDFPKIDDSTIQLKDMPERSGSSDHGLQKRVESL